MDTGRLIIDPPADGAWNMAVDEALLDSASRSGQTILRFYQWSEATVSLGYFQRYKDRLQHAASQDCPAVRRTTGGGAIVHDRELTYSFVTPIADRVLRVEELYRLFHESLVRSLSCWRIEAQRVSDALRPSNPQPFLCFQRRTTGDVTIGEYKIAGSAQRRRRGTVLQHGSILLRQSPAAGELPGIVDISGIALTGEELSGRWIHEIQQHLSMDFATSELTDAEKSQCEGIRRNKFATPAWNKRK